MSVVLPRPRDFDDVYARQYAVMVRLAYVTTGSLPAAEDVVQEAFLELYRRWADVHEPGAYVRRAVVSRCTSWVRRRQLERRHGTHLDAPGESRSASPESVAVRAALARLRPRHRAAVFLRYYLDLPESAIAAALGCRPGTVKSLLHRGLTVLREHFDER
ncbi:MAG: sigma-70 family RNA polymerase sigma factor [Actinocatenispora sp.]